MFNPFAGALGSATGEIDTMKAIIIATKIVLWPIVGAFQLFEQVINLVVAGLKGLELAVLYARYGLAQLNPFGSEEAKQKLVNAIRRVEGELDEANSKFGKSFARHSQYYVTEVDKTTSSVKKLNAAVSATGSSFENNKKYVDEAGKAWGWAMANGEKVAVEWGSVAGTALKNVADSANEAAKNLKPLSAKEAIDQGKASGLTPTASDLEWYKRQTAYQTQLSNSTLTAKEAIEKNLASGLTATAADMEWYRKKMAGAGESLDSLSTNASQAATNLNEYQAKTRELIAQGKASGLTPTASDMEWYRARMSETGAAIPQTAALAAVPQPPAPPTPNPIPAIEALSTKQTTTNAHLAQIDAKTLPQQQINPVPQLQVANTNLTAVQEYIKGVTASIGAAKNELKQQIAASSNNIQARIQEGTSATRAITNAFSAGINVRVTNSPTVKFDMGAVGPVGGGIGGFPKTSGYGMRWGKMHTGNDYGMPVGTKLGIGGPGKVLGAGYWGGYGNTMDIGGPGGMVYRFAHLSKFNAPVGANLPPGYPFALSGNTGNSTGPHLHFEARPGGAGPVNPDAFAGIIRANFGGTPLGPLMGAMGTEMQNMPYGSQLAVSNSDEIFMKPKQMAHVIESSARAGAEGVGNVSMSGVTININGYDKDPKELTDSIASELLTAIYRKSRSEVLTS
jgi:murein DD-endopeptidase MepM/ murein hydrolase activator NlpD